MDKSVYKQVVIAFLHNSFNSYLLQLRDFKPAIIYPGYWGAFGGAVEAGETPEIALGRELMEEIGFSPETLGFFREVNVEKHKLDIHIFYSRLSVSPAELNLMEGSDIGLFTIEEILSGNLYSSKLGKAFPVVPLLSDLFVEFLKYVDENIETL